MKKLLIGTALALFAANAASATVYTQTWTGTVKSGVDSANVFGGGSMAGKSFVATYVFDDSIGSVQINNGVEHSARVGSNLGSVTPNLSSSIAINGFTFNFVGTAYAEIYASREPGFSYLSSSARTATTYLTNSVYDVTSAAFADPSFAFSGSVPSGFSSAGQFEFGGEKLLFTNLTYSVAAAPAPAAVPEPASWAMMIGGLAVAGAAMRRRKAVVRFA